MSKVLQGIIGLLALGSGAFSVSFAAAGNSHNENRTPSTGGIYDKNGVTKSPEYIKVQIEETPTPEPTQVPEPTQEPTPTPGPVTSGGNSGGGGGGGPSPRSTTWVDPRSPTSPKPSTSTGPIRLPR